MTSLNLSISMRIVYLITKILCIEVRFLTNNGDYNEAFCHLWPTKIENDITKINSAIVKENSERRVMYQRAIQLITKPKYMVFNILLIVAFVHSEQRKRTWLDTGYNNKKKRGLSNLMDIIEYMKSWKFKELKLYIHHTQ